MLYVLEAVIWLFLILGGAVLIEWIVRIKEGSAVLPVKIFSPILTLALVTVFYGSFIEPKILTVKETNIPLVSFDKSFPTAGRVRIALVSDFHMGWWKDEKWTKQVVEKINGENPELVLIAGDFILSKMKDASELGPLADFNAPVYAVLGNHDHKFADADKVVAKLEELGVVVFRNRHTRVKTENGEIDLAGVDDVWYSADADRALPIESPGVPVVLISHNPDIVLDSAVERADLVLSAHTHGGHIRLPIIGPVPPLPTKLGRHYDMGLFEIGKRGLPLFITTGVGESGVRARLFNPPRIDMLTIEWEGKL